MNMKLAIIDCFSGISGDMTIAALIACGVPVEYLREQLNKLNLSDYSLNVSKTSRHHIHATKVDVMYDASKQPERTYASIVKLLEESDLTGHIKTKAKDAFRILAEAEAKIHDIQVNKVHFHEVGAVDSIIDLVGSIIGFDFLGVQKILTRPVPLGTGFTKTEHGMMPVPSPAALEILKDYPIEYRQSDYEMTTPTGATLIKLLSDGIIQDNTIFIHKKHGYGAGSKKVAQWPNLLRIILAEDRVNMADESMMLLETNIDDMNPEIYTHVLEKLYQAGAKDVFLTPIIMKKGRPGIKLSVLSAEINIKAMEEIMFLETTTIGIRKYSVNRRVLPRKIRTVDTKYGKIKVKVIDINGEEVIRPEYEQCISLSKKYKVSLLKVYQEISNLKI
jgi:uncharacterized protein (TIGR00299 family) protein